MHGHVCSPVVQSMVRMLPVVTQPAAILAAATASAWSVSASEALPCLRRLVGAGTSGCNCGPLATASLVIVNVLVMVAVR